MTEKLTLEMTERLTLEMTERLMLEMTEKLMLEMIEKLMLEMIANLIKEITKTDDYDDRKASDCDNKNYGSFIMKKIIDKVNFFRVNRELMRASDPDLRRYLENVLILVLYTPYFVFGLIAHLCVRNVLDVNPLYYHILTVYLFFVIILFIFLGMKKLNVILTSHIINLGISISLVLIYFAYFKYFELAFWLLPIVVIMPTLFHFQYTTYFYSVVTVTILFIHIVFVKHVQFAGVNYLENFFFLVIYILMLMKLYYLKLLQKETVIYLQNQIKEVIEQKTELAVMYEEVIATQEELKENNIKLTEYTREIEKMNKDVDFYSNYDPLTRLPNRNLMTKTLNNLIDGVYGQEQDYFSFLILDLNDFKIINDTLGHHVGDEVLKIVSSRLQNRINTKDILFRIGGDEFAIILTNRRNREETKRYVESILGIFEQIIQVDSYELYCNASVGVSVYPEDANNVEGLVGAADTSMYISKQDKGSDITFYKEEMKQEIMKRADRKKLLGKALENEQLFCEFQPLVDSLSSKIRGFEALVRWVLPGQGVIPPNEFIDIAEKNGMISDITKFVLKQACLAVKNLSEIYKEEFYISVNLSPVQFINKDVINEVKSVVAEYEVDPSKIVLEVTETSYINNKVLASEIITEFRNFGFRLAIDDFGTGYSSLDQLIKVPCDIIKIDRSFVNIIDEGSEYNPEILDSVVTLANTLKMKVVAEGVETIEQIDYLRKIKCDVFQGYYFSKPIRLEEIIQNVAQDKFVK